MGWAKLKFSEPDKDGKPLAKQVIFEIEVGDFSE